MTIAIILLILEVIVFICSVIFEHFHHSSLFFSILSLVIVAAALLNCTVHSLTKTEISNDSSEEYHTYRVIDSADTTIIIKDEVISTTTEMKVSDTTDNVIYTIVVPSEDKLELGTAFEATKKQFEKDYKDRIKNKE